MGDLKLDDKHAANPSVETCFLCGEAMGVVLFGKLSEEQKYLLKEAGASDPRDPDRAPFRICFGNHCDQCADHMKSGVILISADEERSTDPRNPYRTGGWCVVRDEAIQRIVGDPELREWILERRMAFVPDDVWDAIGLPR